MIVLGIESSCDDTAAAIIRDNQILSSVVANQHHIHQRFGGIVPELASRDHLVKITTVVEQALENAQITLAEVELIAATQGPGLIGSLLVGFCFAKSLAYRLAQPVVGVDHLSGHILSPFLERTVPAFPYIALIVSGGTTALFFVQDFSTYRLIGRTRDDAAGEAFDKIARMLNLGYPGGPIIAERARHAAALDTTFPRAWLEEGSLDFSFSGLKTAVSHYIAKARSAGKADPVNSVCRAFQEAVVEVLVKKTLAAAQKYQTDQIVVGGGVAANEALREALSAASQSLGISSYLPAQANCTDNAAMIAFAGLKNFQAGRSSTLSEDVFPRSTLGN